MATNGSTDLFATGAWPAGVLEACGPWVSQRRNVLVTGPDLLDTRAEVMGVVAEHCTCSTEDGFRILREVGRRTLETLRGPGARAMAFV